ncbi:MAG: LamG-like jellyroll fold domain-containing protein [Roseibacillus sp.]
MQRLPILRQAILAASVLALAFPLASAQFATGLVAYWAFDGDLTDSTATGAHGTFVDPNVIPPAVPTASFLPAKFGDGLNLNEFPLNFDQYVDITGAPEGTFDFVGGSMTISAWVATPALTLGNQTIISKGPRGTWSLQRDGDINTTPAFFGGLGAVATGDPSNPDHSLLVGFPATVLDAPLIHVVGVVETGVGLRLYVNGQLAGTASGNVQLTDSPFNLTIGAKPDNPLLAWWEGIIDDLAIWSRALSGGEIATIYNNGTGVSIADILNPVDSDNDGMPDYYENSNGLDPNADDSGDDLDADGRTNLEEFQDGTRPNNPDTDGDGLTDGEEATLGTNPTSSDSDGDKILDPDEIAGSTNPFLNNILRDPFDPLSDPPGDPTDPTLSDSDGDTFDDGTEITFGNDPNDINDAPSTWQNALKGYWPLDRASFNASDPDPAMRFFPDASGRGHPGVWDGSSTAPAWFGGKFGTSVARINGPAGGGAQHITIQGSESDLACAGGDISISAWFRSVGFTKNWQCIVAKGEGNSWRIHRRGTSTPGVCAYAGGTADIPGADIGPRVDDFEWHHVVAVTEAGVETRLYVDGALIASSPNAPTLDDNGLAMQIGGNPGAANREMVGLIEEVAVWGRVLGAGEIALIHLNGAGATIAQLIEGLDRDNDGLSDIFEDAFGLDKNDPSGENGADGDPDMDGRTNSEERGDNTHPTVADTDGDGLDDGEEFTAGTDPLDPDTDGDGLDDSEELSGSRNPFLNHVLRSPFTPGVDPNGDPTDPLLRDSDGDIFSDLLEIANGSDPNDVDSTPHITIVRVVGTGTGALLGGDLTDPEDDGDDRRAVLVPGDGLAERGWNFINAVANEKSSFEEHEAAFNIFDNKLGPSQDNWCCNARNITIEFAVAYQLTHFTVSSADDVPNRDWRVWRLLGSEDGTNFEIIHEEPGAERLWLERLQVVRFDLPSPAPAYRFFRFEADTNWGDNLWQLGEVELFGFDPNVQQPSDLVLKVPAGGYNAGTQMLSVEVSGAAAGEAYHLRSSTDGETFSPLVPTFDFDDSTIFPVAIPVDVAANGALLLQVFGGPSIP